MGTRNLTAVFLDGEYKVAQYGQWDGYPNGQGMTTLCFLRERMNEDLFKTALRNSSYISQEDLDTLWRKYGADESGRITLQNADKMKRDYPEFSRDTGAEILDIIQSRPDGMQLEDSLTFAANSLFCEWAWVIDLDAGTFEAYEGFNTEKPLTEDDRFFFLNDQAENGYYPIKLVAIWDLDDLPSNESFLAAFKTDEEDD